MAQQPDFKSPLDIPILLNGNFGEIRSNHFHTGIDLKTKGETGLPVLSVEDGFVSRISVSASGYGNALYVNHPNGYTSVYGHLEKFAPEIAQWVKEQQYKQKSFEVNLNPERNQFKVKKGQEIAKSGNSGSSAGPHLHFEIRDTKSEHSKNPLFFNFDIKDETKPVVENLYVYPVGNNSHAQNKTTKQAFKLVFYGDSYHLKGVQAINLYGEVGFGVDAIDYIDGTWSKCGIYQMEYWVDNQLINSFQLDELDFAKNRYINSHIDYEAFVREGRKIHKTYIEPGDQLDIYQQTANRGLFNFNDGKRHKVQIILFDTKMNASEIEFYAVSTTPIKRTEPGDSDHFAYNKTNHFETDSVIVDIPNGALYSDLDFDFKVGNKPAGAYSARYKIHSRYTPLQKTYALKIKPGRLPKKLESKALIAQVNTQTGKFTSVGGWYENGWVIATPIVFGNFCVVADTIAPSIHSLSIKNDILQESQKIRFKITDDLSGIKTYTGTIDNKWVLFEYDAKRDLLEYNIDNHLKRGQKHLLELTVEDAKGNANTYTANFNY